MLPLRACRRRVAESACSLCPYAGGTFALYSVLCRRLRIRPHDPRPVTEGGAAGRGVAAAQDEDECGWGGGRPASVTHGAARGQQKGAVDVTWRRRNAGARRDGSGTAERIQEGDDAAAWGRQAVQGGGGAPMEQQGVRRGWGSWCTGGATGEVVRRFFRRSRGAQVRLGTYRAFIIPTGLHAAAYLATGSRILDLCRY